MELLNLSPGDHVAFEIKDDKVQLFKSYFCVKRKNGKGGLDVT
jgi:hypothetical protein